MEVWQAQERYSGNTSEKEDEMRILLVQPPFPPSRKAFGLPSLPEPLALEILAAYLPEHEVRILDLRVEAEDLKEVIASFRPEVVGVTALTTEVYAALEVLRQSKELVPGVTTVAGGLHASLVPLDFQKEYVDVIVIGEGELTFCELVGRLESNGPLDSVEGIVYKSRSGDFHSTGPRKEKVKLDTLPLPRRDLTAQLRDRYFFLFRRPCAALEASRGCPYRCSFCSVWKFHNGKCRYMSPERVLRELKTVSEQHTIFVDDNFLQDAKRAERLYELIKASGIKKSYGIQGRADSIARNPHLIEKWKEIGLAGVLVGFETQKEARLERLSKGSLIRENEEAIQILHANGVRIWGAFIVEPDFDAQDFKHLRDYMNKKKITFRQITILTPLPGTDLYEERFRDLITNDYRLFDCLHSVLPTKLPAKEFYREYAKLQRSYSLRCQLSVILSGSVSPRQILFGKSLVRRMGRPQTYLDNLRAAGARIS